MTQNSAAVRSAIDEFEPAFEDINKAVHDVSRDIVAAKDRVDTLIDGSETIFRGAVELGGSASGRDGEMITLAQTTAARITSVLNDALAANKITREAMFDDNYRPVDGTNPLQQADPRGSARLKRQYHLLRGRGSKRLSADPQSKVL